MNQFKEQCKIHMSKIEEAYSYQLGLKNNIEYEKWADENIIKITNYFTNKYPMVKIQDPKYRIKSDSSLLGKIKNLQIERLSKLSVLKELSIEQEEELYQLIKERVYEKSQENIEEILKTIEDIIKTKSIEKIDMEQVEETIKKGSLSDSTKTALLRTLVGKIEKSDLQYKAIILETLDNIFGKEAAHKSKREEDNLIRYESIEAIKNNPEKLEELQNAHRYLKAKDLIGMEIIIKEVPDNFETENEKIKEWIVKRKEATEQYYYYDNLICTAVGTDFVSQLAEETELLNKSHRKIIEDSKKHKKKSNGYEADHIKIESTEKPEYTFEIQIKSKYVEELGKEGSAAHEKRPGKLREIPNIDRIDFVQELKRRLPRYKVLKEKQGRYSELEAYTTTQNCIKFFEKKIQKDSEWYIRAEKRIEEEEVKKVI